MKITGKKVEWEMEFPCILRVRSEGKVTGFSDGRFIVDMGDIVVEDMTPLRDTYRAVLQCSNCGGLCTALLKKHKIVKVEIEGTVCPTCGNPGRLEPYMGQCSPQGLPSLDLTK